MSKLGLDAVLTGTMMQAKLLCAAGRDLGRPYLSSLFGDFTKGFPPLWRRPAPETFFPRTPSACIARFAAGVLAQWHVVAAPHGGFPGAPARDDLDREVRRFVHRRGANEMAWHEPARPEARSP